MYCLKLRLNDPNARSQQIIIDVVFFLKKDNFGSYLLRWCVYNYYENITQNNLDEILCTISTS